MDKFLYMVEKETPSRRVTYTFTCPKFDARYNAETSMVDHLYYFQVQISIYEIESKKQTSREVKELDLLTLQSRQGGGWTWKNIFEEYSTQHYAYLDAFVKNHFNPIAKNEAIIMAQKFNQFDKDEGPSDFYEI